MATSITQFGIEISFDDDYTVGQYVNGDYYVVGPVSVTGIAVSSGDHASGSVAGQDGAMINPVPGVQGFDNRAPSYDASTNKVAAGFPFSLSAGDSLIAAESLASPYNTGGTQYIYLNTAIVLTCVASEPAATAFRPHYSRVGKVTYDWAAVNLTETPLLSLATVANTPDLADTEALIERVQLDLIPASAGRALHPKLNMHDYGADICGDYGTCLLMCMLDSATIGDKTTLLKRIIQVGIDYYGLISNGAIYDPNGGHHPGRKTPIIFAGYLLQASALRDLGYSTIFAEDGSVFYVSQTDVDRTNLVELTGTAQGGSATTITLASSVPTSGDYNLAGLTIQLTGGTGSGQSKVISAYDRATRIATVPWDTAADGTSVYAVHSYEAGDIGDAEWGINHSTAPARDNPSMSADYRRTNASNWWGHALPLLAFGLDGNWGNAAFFDYMERWRTLGTDVDTPAFDLAMRTAYWGDYYSAPSPTPRLVVRGVPR